MATTAHAFGASSSIQRLRVLGLPVSGSLPIAVQYPSSAWMFSLGIEPSTTKMNGASSSPFAAWKNGRRKSSPVS